MRSSDDILTNRKILLAFALALLIIGVSIYANKKEATPKPIAQKTTVTQTAQTETLNLEELVQKDSDGDGVPDWEESLWGTNPTNTDTFGHGLGDRAEIDKMKIALRGNAKTDGAISGEDTQTSLFAKQLYSSVLALKQSGNFTDTTAGSLSVGVTNNIKEQAKEKIYYVASDLKIVGEATSSIEAYRGDIVRIATKYEKAGLGDEILILASVVDNKNPAGLKNLDKNIVLYRKILGENLFISVPKNMAQNHLILVNGYRNVLESLSQAGEIFSDPIAGLVEITRYRNSTNSILIALAEIERYFASRGTIMATTTPQVK